MFNIMHFLVLFCILFPKSIYSDDKVVDVDSTSSIVQKITNNNKKNLPSNYETVQIWYPKVGLTFDFHNRNYFNFFVFGQNITVRLDPIQFNLINEHTPIWLGNWKNGTFVLEKLPSFTSKQQLSWYATSPHSVIGTGFENGVAYFIGKVKNMSMVPYSKEEAQKLRRRRRDVDSELLPGTEDPTGSLVLSDYHKIYIFSEEDNVDFSDTIKTSLKEEVELDNMKFLKRTKRSSINRPKFIRRKILLYADYGSQFIEPRGLLFNRLVLYIISFWNNVNAYFQYLNNPKISFQIAGIIIASNDLAAPFLLTNHVGFAKIASKEALVDMNSWLHLHQDVIPKNTYDIAITTTSRRLFESRKNRRKAVDGAVKSSVDCQNQMSTNITAIIRDEKFLGISTAVDELTYIMNIGYESTSSPNQDTCNPNNGATVYSGNSTYPNNYRDSRNMLWLNCHTDLTCGRKPDFVDTGKPLPNILPGEIISLNEQCQRFGYKKSCSAHDYFNCNGFLWCEVEQIVKGYFWDSKQVVCRGVNTVLDGTLCGKDRFCFNKRCIPYMQDMWIQNVFNKN